MKELKTWIKSHPDQIVMLFVWGILCGLLFETGARTHGIILGLIGWGLFCLFMWRWPHKVLAVALCVSLLAVPRTKAAPALAVGAIVVIIVGGVVAVKIAKRCKRIARDREHRLTNEAPFMVAGESGEYGAAFWWSEYCEADRPVADSLPVVTVLDITVHSASNATVTVSANAGHEFVQSWEEFTDEITVHGLATATGPNFSSYERNRHPVTSEQVPVSFNFDTRTVTIGSGGVLVTVEHSDDLRQWEPLMKINAEEVAHLKIEDASEQKQFYRVKLGATTAEPL